MCKFSNSKFCIKITLHCSLTVKYDVTTTLLSLPWRPKIIYIVFGIYGRRRSVFEPIRLAIAAVIHKMCSDNLRLCSDKGLFVQ